MGEARAAGSQHLATLALNFIGNGLYMQGDPAAARPVFEQVRDGFRSVGGRHGAAVVTIQIGLCALEGGDQHEARTLVREGLQLARELDFRWGKLLGLDGAALLAARMSNWEVAATLLGATELPRQASPAPQVRVREPAIAAVQAALDPDTLSVLWDKASAMPWMRQSPTRCSISKVPTGRLRYRCRARRREAWCSSIRLSVMLDPAPGRDGSRRRQPEQLRLHRYLVTDIVTETETGQRHELRRSVSRSTTPRSPA